VVATLGCIPRRSSPPAVWLRSADHLTLDQQAALPAANLPAVADELKTGAPARYCQWMSSTTLRQPLSYTW
jgi:hypothetical protein